MNFKEKAKLIHKDKYDYSKVVYINGDTKVCIYCPTHGYFWQLPRVHLSGSGCYACGRDSLRKHFSLPDNLTLPENTTAVPIGNNTYCIIDTEDYPIIKRFKWKLTNGYAVSRYGDSILKMHRLVLDVWADSVHVDHINGDPLDNRKLNLRLCNRNQNMRNRGKINSVTSSKYKGVSWRKDKRKWKSYITFNNKQVHLGYFDDEVEAARAYDEAAKKYFKDFAKLNFNLCIN